MQDGRGKRILELVKNANLVKKPKIIVHSVVSLNTSNTTNLLEQEVLQQQTEQDLHIGLNESVMQPSCETLLEKEEQNKEIRDLDPIEASNEEYNSNEEDNYKTDTSKEAEEDTKDNWGVTAYAISLFLLTLWWSAKWEDATACPYCPIEDIVDGTKTFKSAVYIICAQLMAAFFTYRYVQILWLLELVETHKGRAYEECTADLQVDMIVGAFIECILTCLCRLVSRILSEKDFKYGTIIDAIFSTAMVVVAFNFSGGYFNPALATSLKFGCAGNTLVEHIVVYWLGACAGSILSLFIFKTNIVQNYCKKPKRD